MNILLVDNSRIDMAVMVSMLNKMEHQVLQSHSAEEALAMFGQNIPDMVLMAVTMPGIGAFNAVSEMRRIALDNWIPIIFTTVPGHENDIVRGIEAGGDDYLLKPIHYPILCAKIKVQQQHLNLFRRTQEQNFELSEYRIRNKEEQGSAQALTARILSFEQIKDPLVHFHFHPADVFSGDLIAATRSPAGHLYAMLADSSGHGQAAALAVMPVLQAFYTMVAKGYTIGAIAAEINRKIIEYLPANRFVATALVALDAANNRMSVWNGGCPPVVLLNSDGTVAHRFDSSHLPLGILPPYKFDDMVTYCRYDNSQCQVLMCSDGAINNASSGGLESGMAHLLQVAQTENQSDWLSAMVKILPNQLANRCAHDDIALILLDCPADEVEEFNSLAQVTASMPSENSQPSKVMLNQVYTGDSIDWRFDLTLTAPQLRQIDILPMLLNVVKHIEQTEAQALSSKLFLVLSELFNNALDHGLLGLDSSLKNNPLGMDVYYDERATRLSKLVKGEIKIKLMKVSGSHGPCLKITVTDSGDGFDVQAAQTLTLDSDMRRYGHGLALVKSLSGDMYYTDLGSKSHTCIPLRDPEQCQIAISMNGCNPAPQQTDKKTK